MLARHELDEISHILLKAADYIEKHGHIKGKLWDNYGRVCAIGAVGKVADDHFFVKRDSQEALIRLEAAVGGVCNIGIAEWNNKPERTPEEVIAKFKEVAYDPKYAKVPA